MPQRVNIASIRDAIAVVRHLLQLFRFQLQEPNARRKLRRQPQSERHELLSQGKIFKKEATTGGKETSDDAEDEP
jgi:hypothetical protein